MDRFKKAYRISIIVLSIALIVFIIIGGVFSAIKLIPILTYESEVIELTEDMPEYSSTLRLRFSYFDDVIGYLFDDSPRGYLEYQLNITMKNRLKEFTHLDFHMVDSEGFQVGKTYSAITYIRQYSSEMKIVNNMKSDLTRIVNNDGAVVGYRFEGSDSYMTKPHFDYYDLCKP